MDKLGPICRDAFDCAIIFDIIRGSDGYDRSVIDAAFNFDANRPLKDIRIGYVKAWFEGESTEVLDAMRAQGVELIEVSFPDMNILPLSLILTAEASAAFEDLTLSNRDDLLVRQIRNAWPNVFRAGRFIPAVDYLQANRLRTRLIEATHQALSSVDVVIVPSDAGNQLLLTNLTGHPAMVMPTKDGTSITFVGQLFDEATLIRTAMAWQSASGYHLQQPPLFSVTPQ
jgi:Asp-tRNA(Asn)/Glu-tRNA(Gln) amidotransferase A subunit family amidase